MILNREIYQSYTFPFRFFKVLKKYFIIFFYFLSRPKLGKKLRGLQGSLGKEALTLLVDSEGILKCNSCKECVSICPTQCIQVSSPDGKSLTTPALFHFEPLECMNCNLCVEICPEDALAFEVRGEMAGHCETPWAKDLHELAFRENLNGGRGLTIEDVTQSKN